MTAVSASVRAIVYARAGSCCELCGRYAYGGSVHHRRRRGMGGSKRVELGLASNLLLLCGSGTTGCHGEVESDRSAAYQRGLLLRDGQPPTETPVDLRHGRVLLNDEGQYIPIEGAA